MNSCVFPGSFDPVTLGHMDVILRASRLFDRVTVAVMVNIRKKGALMPDQRVALLEKACRDLSNVSIVRWDGLLADYMRQTGERCLIRGVRGATEFDAESTNAQINRMLCPEIETLLMPAADSLACLSSSMVREIASFGGDIRPYVPASAAEEIQELLSKLNN